MKELREIGIQPDVLLCRTDRPLPPDVKRKIAIHCNLDPDAVIAAIDVETERWEAVRFEADLCEAVLRGYLSQARPFLTDHDSAYMYDAVRVITFELGLRFFTDYLEGNVYFKASNPGHDLSRALVQFRLTEGIDAEEKALRALIRDMR